MKHILSIQHERLETACHQLNISALDDDDYIFLEEYVECITPIAISLKSLEANKYSFGIYLPILVGLRTAFNRLHEKNLIHCEPLITALQNGFETRFGDLMDIFNSSGKSAPLYLAMCSNPLFKLNYLGFEQRIPTHTINKMRDMLLAAAKEILQNRKDHPNVAADTTTTTTTTTTSSVSGRRNEEMVILILNQKTKIKKPN